jgi:uncharacterized membrane protein
MNNSGLVGEISYPDGEGHATVWDGGTVTLLPALGGSGMTDARVVTESGIVGGEAPTNSGEIHSVIWRK